MDIKPLSGPMDTRSSPDALQSGVWRWRQNIAVYDQGKACRRPGWQKYQGSKATYNNEDLHDQLLSLQTYYDDRTPPYANQEDITTYPPGNDTNGIAKCGSSHTRATGRQPITFLYEAITTSGVRKLLAGTQNRLYTLDESRGNWKIIADAYGGDPGNGLKHHWQCAQVNDCIVFTNNYDPPIAHILEQPTMGCAQQAVSEIASLAEIGLTKAGAICSWKGTIIFGDVEMDGARVEHRVVWSKFDAPLEFVPSNDSTANYQDLQFGGRILGFKPLGDVLLIYTTKSIWQMQYAGDPQVFSFSERYAEPENGAGCLAYRRTLVSTGQEHIYLGKDGIYTFSLFQPQPQRVEWLHRSSSEIFNTLNDSACDDHVAWFNSASKELFISWVEVGQTVPIQTLCYNTQYETSDVIDHGFTAYCNHAADNRGSIVDWLLSLGACTPEELVSNADIAPVGVKEGGYCTGSGQANPDTLPSRTTPIWTNGPKWLDGRLIEDYDAPMADTESLCSIFGDLNLQDICEECAKSGPMLMASATDWCIKEYAPNSGVYFREVTTAFTACGTWTRVGYDSILRTGPIDFGLTKSEKTTRSLEVEYFSVYDAIQALPTALQVRIGTSAQAVDPNITAPGRCALVWRTLSPRNLECLSLRSGDEHLAAGTRPAFTADWQFFFTGRFLHWELKISGMHGAVAFSRMTAEVRQNTSSPQG